MADKENHPVYDNPVWEKSMSVAKDVFKLTAPFAAAEPDLTKRMRDSAMEMPTFIAQGCAAATPGEAAKYFEMARASGFALGTGLHLGSFFGFCPDTTVSMLCGVIDDITKALAKLMKLRIPTVPGAKQL